MVPPLSTILTASLLLSSSTRRLAATFSPLLHVISALMSYQDAVSYGPARYILASLANSVSFLALSSVWLHGGLPTVATGVPLGRAQQRARRSLLGAAVGFVLLMLVRFAYASVMPSYYAQYPMERWGAWTTKLLDHIPPLLPH